MEKKFAQFVNIIAKDPAVDSVVGFTGGGGGGPRGGGVNSANVFIQLKPLAQRQNQSTDQIIPRDGEDLGGVAGRAHFPAQHGKFPHRRPLRALRPTNTRSWATRCPMCRNGCPRSPTALENVPELLDVNSDQQDSGLEVALAIDRATANRLASRRRRSTARSTTPSASARFPRSITTSTSITSSWAWRRSSGRARRP